MQKKEFAEKTRNVLLNPPQRTIQSEVSFFFGFFKKSEFTSITLSKDIIRDYAAFIEKNYKGFTEPEPKHNEGTIYYKTASEDNVMYKRRPADDDPAYRYKREVEIVENDNVLFSLSPSESGLKSVLEKTKSEETFSDMLIRLQREQNLKAPELYHAAGIDYKHYSKIISDRSYKTSKATVFAFAIALHLDLKTTEDLLRKAGHAINPSDMFDMTIKYFIQTRCYDRTKIDMLMETFELPLLPQNW